jgi:hypothetical protein
MREGGAPYDLASSSHCDMSLRYDVAGISTGDGGAPLNDADKGWYRCGFPSRPTSSLRPALNNANTRLITLRSVQSNPSPIWSSRLD